MQKTIKNLEELAAEAADFIEKLVPSEQATLVTLSGELGAGKTAFTKAIAKALGVDEVVNSPTFVLEKIYLLGAEQKFKRLVHIDAYRLESGTDLAPLGFDELMQDSGNLIMLEWPEKVSDKLSTPTIAIMLALQADGSRMMSYG